MGDTFPNHYNGNSYYRNATFYYIGTLDSLGGSSAPGCTVPTLRAGTRQHAACRSVQRSCAPRAENCWSVVRCHKSRKQPLSRSRTVVGTWCSSEASQALAMPILLKRPRMMAGRVWTSFDWPAKRESMWSPSRKRAHYCHNSLLETMLFYSFH